MAGDTAESDGSSWLGSILAAILVAALLSPMLQFIGGSFDKAAPNPTPTTSKDPDTSATEPESPPEEDLLASSEWRCVCETGFLPPGMLQSFGGAEAVLRMSAGQCYHKTK